MPKKICVFIQVWNSKTFLPYCIKQFVSWADYIIINEANWVNDPDWNGNTSPDGSASIIENFISENPNNNILFNKAGFVSTQHEARNAGLKLVPGDTTHLFISDSDEFYFQSDLIKIRKLVEHQRFDAGHVVIPAHVFYYGSSLIKNEPFVRIYNWFPNQRFFALSSMISTNNKEFDLSSLNVWMYHFSYFNIETTKIKGAINNDVTADHYKNWWNNIYSQYDGSNLEELYRKNKDGIHVNGSGRLELYNGPFPEVLIGSPILKYRWSKDRKD